MLKSFQTVTKAKDGIRKVKELCANGGFNLTKFTSNSEEVLKSIPDEDRRRNVSDEALTFDKLPEDKALGVKWNISKDTLGFQTKWAENPSTSTRCGLLSMLSSIYYPLGLGAPFLLKVQQWHYVSSQSNPANYAFRGSDVRSFEKIHTWFSGPSFF